MPVSCAACTNRYKVGQNIHFFRFPISKNELMTKWLSAMRRKQFEATQWSRLCSVHFTEQDFQIRPGANRLLLKNNAVPSIFPSLPSNLKKPNKIPRKTPTLKNTCTKDVTVDQLENNIYQCDDMHSITNFKSVEIQTETSHSNEEMHKNKIKTLQQKLRRKNKKIENLEDLVKNIKHSKLPNKKQDTQSLHLDDVQIASEETNDNCKSDNTNLNLGGICQDLSNYNDFEATIKQFDGCVGKMKRAFNLNKAYFLPAIKSFVKSMNKNVKTHAELCSAMKNFGNKRIGTKATARTRQKTLIGKRNNLTAGRTPNWRRVPEHGYAIRISSSR